MSKIEWTDETWNPVWGCFAKCKYCYAAKQAVRFARKLAEKEAKFRHKLKAVREVVEEKLYKDLIAFKPTFLKSQFSKKFKKKTKRVFVGSMTDLAFWQQDWLIDLVYKMESLPKINFQILTKFPEKLQHINFPENVWVGITAETQKKFNDRMYNLLQIEAGKHFVSLEPLQAEINLLHVENIIGHLKTFRPNQFCGSLDWVIAGGQTGRYAKPMHPYWLHRIVNACKKLDIPFFFKSWGNWSPKPVKQKLTSKADFKYVKVNGLVTYSSDKKDSIIMFKNLNRDKVREINGLEHSEFPE